MAWIISKSFEFDYGHRVHTQSLQDEYSIDCSCACRHLHGHRGKFIVHLESDTLDTTGMVTDFKHLNFLKKFIDDVFDHKLILDIWDPLLKELFPRLFSSGGFFENLKSVDLGVDSTQTPNMYIYVPSVEFIESLPNESLVELYEGVVFVRFVPTSENLTQWMFNFVTLRLQSLRPGELSVRRIEFYETPKSRSEFFNRQ